MVGDADTDVARRICLPTRGYGSRARISLHLASGISTIMGPQLNGSRSLRSGVAAGHVDQILLDRSANLLAAAKP